MFTLYLYFIIEFLTWKTSSEGESMSCFIKSTGTKTDGTGNLICYYYCNRSGFYTQKSAGLRRIKTQGTSKVNTYCTAFIKSTHDKKTGKIQVSLCHQMQEQLHITEYVGYSACIL